MQNAEILAPAGSLESAVAAINCGADAIYLGAKDFNARKNAENFSDEDFFEIVDYAHERGVKVYVTLNTLVYDDEIKSLINTLKLTCEAGVDALIVQDLAVLNLVRECCPKMPIHASTQMSVHTPKGAEMLKKLGCERVVLSREMSEKEIREVVSSCDIETEVFVHGALCMCVSGQCLMSAMIGQRSGNRGLCAQPCRLPFSANDDRKRCDLSLKDLSLLEQIDALKNLGVSSLKIEGRMKRPEYVAAAVTAFREALDLGYVDEDIKKKLSDVFSRSGFTDGYFTEKRGKAMFGTRSYDDVLAADQKTLKSLALLYQKPRKCVGVNLKLVFEETGLATLFLNDGENEVFSQIDNAVLAVNLPCSKENALKNLSKTGDTPYYVRDLVVENNCNMMLTLSQLNALRRDVLEKISALRRKRKPIKFDNCFSVPSLKKRDYVLPEIYARFDKFSQVPDLSDDVKKVILPIFEINDSVIDFLGDRLIMELPRVKFGCENKVLNKMKELCSLGIKEAIISNIGDILLCKEADVEITGGFGLNITNSVALKEYYNLGVKEVVLSPELLFSKIGCFEKTGRVGIMAYGKLPLMVVRNCPIKNTMSCDKCKRSKSLTDRRGVKFPVKCSEGYSEILNSAPIYLADKDLNFVDFMVLYFTDESKNEVLNVIEDYTKYHSKRDGITRGLYFRGSI